MSNSFSEPKMEIPGLGTVVKDNEWNWYRSQPIPMPVLGGKVCEIIVEGYDEDPNKAEFHVAIANFLSAGPSVLQEAEHHVYQYYLDCNCYWQPDDEKYVAIKSPGDAWQHARFGGKAIVSRRSRGDRRIYISLDCGCDWEDEHGLQIVFKNGLKVNKIGAYDGHLTNSDSYADKNLEDVVYPKADS